MGDNLCFNSFANHWQLTKSTVRPWLGPFVMEGARKVFICLPAPANLTNICLNCKLANLLSRSRRSNYHCKAFPLTWQGEVWLLTMYLFLFPMSQWPCMFLFPMSQSSRMIHIADVISPGLEHMQLCFSSNTPRIALLDYQLSHESKTFKKHGCLRMRILLFRTKSQPLKDMNGCKLQCGSDDKQQTSRLNLFSFYIMSMIKIYHWKKRGSYFMVAKAH